MRIIHTLPAVGAALAALLLWLLGWIAFTHRRFHAYHRREGSPYPPLGGSGWVRFYARTVASILLVTWWQARALFADRLRMPRGEVSGNPVLCVHGFHSTGAYMWGIRRTLEAHGRPTRAVSLGLPHRRPEVYARALGRALGELQEAAVGGAVDLVAHSMGGLIVRLALARRPELAARVERIVTLGSPHRGTAFLRWFRFGPTWRMMHRGAPFLAGLPPLAESAPDAAVTTIASKHDLIVYPEETAYLHGARRITLEGVGHVGLLTETRVRELVAKVLGESRDRRWTDVEPSETDDGG